MSEENVQRLTLEELLKQKSQTDHRRVAETTEEEIRQQIESDPDLYELTDEELDEFRRVSEAKRSTS
jgi:hypothetical protein